MAGLSLCDTHNHAFLLEPEQWDLFEQGATLLDFLYGPNGVIYRKRPGDQLIGDAWPQQGPNMALAGLAN